MAPDEHSPKRRKLSPPLEDETASSGVAKDPTTSGSWYGKSWSRKSLPVTQVARESISSASNTAVEAASIIKEKITPVRRTSSLALTRRSTLAKALPVDATTTKDHAMPESGRASRTKSNDGVRSRSQSKQSRRKSQDIAVVKDVEESSKTTSANDNAGALKIAPAPRSWIGWLAGGDGTHASSMSEPDAAVLTQRSKVADPPIESSTKAADATTDISKSTGSVPKNVVSESSKASAEAPTPLPASQLTQRRSWLPLWNNSVASQSAPTIAAIPADSTLQDTQLAQKTDSVIKDNVLKASDSSDTKPIDEVVKPGPAMSTETPAKPGGWVFFSRQKPTETSSLKDVPREGEIAVANTESESKPRRASIDLNAANLSASITTNKPSIVDEPTKKQKTKDSVDNKSLNDRPAAETRKVSVKGASATAVSPSEAKARQASPIPSKKPYDHLLSPTLRETLRMADSPTLFQQITRLFFSPVTPPPKHLSLVKESPRIRQALAIGVHGYFPAPVLQTVLGRPTGTSIKFAEMAAKSIRNYTKKHKYDCSVKTAALEGEGRIAERIDLLWRLLLNWIEDIRKADFIMVACHSQGVPVAIMLVSKLIHFGCISPTARIGICAMAGINLGPFASLRSRFISGSAGELFEFSDPDSKVATDYRAALEAVLLHGVRLTYVGSIDDQLVSLESSLFAPISHPHIFRAISVDSRLHAPDFLLHLVILALKLRNLGVPDHGLLKELSMPLAGSLYTGDGHSRLYEDEAIYDLAVEFTLETTSTPGIALQRRDTKGSGTNPFILPFAMRGILEEDFVKSELQHEAAQLLKEFDEWEPQSKQLKDVRYRLEGIRSKL